MSIFSKRHCYKIAKAEKMCVDCGKTIKTGEEYFFFKPSTKIRHICMECSVKKKKIGNNEILKYHCDVTIEKTK